ncbi:MAG: TIGR03905 family TSCPD domain-containing protein [Firmicutes bacterium]|nr:TIGR03905 family TSCPD domain-containing protein [Bacillota bacterium]MCD7782721.1 TIGR03905 family TSCPD domain-containing protein [Bacillota bacterium]MCD7830717.1 TIGR03905 family TSCPD domain-containing protein [Bacillota bacterium]
MKSFSYTTSGVCSRQIDFDLDGETIHNVRFTGGCNGNLKAISKLTEGQNAKRIISILKGNTCGPRATSCADQFAKALTEALEAGE